MVTPASKLTSKLTSEVPSVPSTGVPIEMVKAAKSSSVMFIVAAVVSPVTEALFVAAVSVAITVSVNSALVSSTTVMSIVALLDPAGMVTVPTTAVASA